MTHIPSRKCIACFKISDKSSFLRIAGTANGSAIVDISGKSGGRGCYICKNEQCINAAQKQRRIERALKRRIPDEIYEKLRECLI